MQPSFYMHTDCTVRFEPSKEMTATWILGALGTSRDQLILKTQSCDCIMPIIVFSTFLLFDIDVADLICELSVCVMVFDVAYEPQETFSWYVHIL
jgi:hypothetical protein